MSLLLQNYVTVILDIQERFDCYNHKLTVKYSWHQQIFILSEVTCNKEYIPQSAWTFLNSFIIFHIFGCVKDSCAWSLPGSAFKILLVF